MSIPEARRVQINGLAVRLLQGGAGPPLVYLHGAAPAAEWLPLLQRLAESFTVYAPDHPGFGDTDRPEWLEGVDDLVLHYDELFHALNLERPAVVGFSFGGWVAAEIAVTYPDRLRAMVLLNAAGLHVEGALIPDLPALAPETLAQTVFHDAVAAREWFSRAADPEERVRRYRGMATLALLAWNPWFDPKLARRLYRIQCPTLAMWGEHDRLIPPIYGEAYREGIPGCELRLLPDCGHMAPIERPDAVAAAIREFVERD